MIVISSENYQIIRSLTVKDLKLKYKNSILGYFWSLLHPVIYISIFYVVFSNAFPAVENYSLYVISGILFWTFFATSSSQIINSIVGNASIIKSIYIPSYFFALSMMMSGLVNLLLALIPFLFIMLFLGAPIGFHLIMVVPVTILLGVFTYGLSLALCSLNVFYRDVSILWLSLSPALFYATPIAYSSDIIPEKWLWLYNFNPLVHYFDAIHNVLYDGKWLSINQFLLMTAISLLFLWLGQSIYKKLAKGFVSNL